MGGSPSVSLNKFGLDDVAVMHWEAVTAAHTQHVAGPVPSTSYTSLLFTLQLCEEGTVVVLTSRKR